MEVDSLNTLVSGAIWRAEQLEEHGIGSASQAWLEVSRLEEELARALPVSQPEGRIARRGAVRAALKARDYARARGLADAFTAEAGVPRSLTKALRELLEEEDRSLSRRFRHAAKLHTLDEARALAKRTHQAGPFGLGA